MLQDKTLTCRDCGESFDFTASEQDFYAEKGFQNEPTRCAGCRAARKANANNRGGRQGSNGRQQRELFDVVCAECGADTKVPFRPSSDRPVYCRDCYEQNRQ